jgi:hypothetical protein
MPMPLVFRNLLKTVWDEAENSPDLQNCVRTTLDLPRLGTVTVKVCVNLRDPRQPEIRIVPKIPAES